MTLEQSIIDMAKKNLLKLKDNIHNPHIDEEVAKLEYSITLSSLLKLTELAHIAGSGISHDGAKHLLKIESEVDFLWINCSLCKKKNNSCKTISSVNSFVC